MNGVLIVDKPTGMTSHDVVNQVRRLAGMRRVGHAGTLDPMATGVLVLLLGSATRLSRFATAHTKRYLGIARLGETTTTYDAEGVTVNRLPVDVDRPAIERALVDFRGPIEQIPPMYSAIRVQGRRLYDLAREGEEIERKARPVDIYALEIITWQSPDLTLDIRCSSGTYIRSLAHDLGHSLGCGAHLRALRRLESGPFSLAHGHTLDELQSLKAEGSFESALLPPQAALGSMPAAHLDRAQEQAVRYGQPINLNLSGDAELVQAQDQDGHLISVLCRLPDSHYRPTIVFPTVKHEG